MVSKSRGKSLKNTCGRVNFLVKLQARCSKRCFLINLPSSSEFCYCYLKASLTTLFQATLCLTKTQCQYITDLLVTIYAPKSPPFQFKVLGETDRFSVGALSKVQSSRGQLFETTFLGDNCTRTLSPFGKCD